MANLVVGKFYPPHRGHHYLIDRALADGPTYVLILWSEKESIGPNDRYRWLCEQHPLATVIAARDEYRVDYSDDGAWANHVGVMKEALRNPSLITHVYGSESYVPRLASHFNAWPVTVDLARKTFAVSGTAVRSDVRANWQYLAPPVRAGLCKRIVCIGAESCGTTTLARDLAQHYDTVWVPEYGRMYSEGIRDKIWTHSDLIHIAQVQRHLEEAMARHAEDGVLICDTNTLATRIWEEFLVGPSKIHSGSADLYILTDICPWEDDGVRFLPEQRYTMQEQFRQHLQENNLTWIEVRGNREQRVQTAVKAIDQLTWRFNPPRD